MQVYMQFIWQGKVYQFWALYSSLTMVSQVFTKVMVPMSAWVLRLGTPLLWFPVRLGFGRDNARSLPLLCSPAGLRSLGRVRSASQPAEAVFGCGSQHHQSPSLTITRLGHSFSGSALTSAGQGFTSSSLEVFAGTFCVPSTVSARWASVNVDATVVPKRHWRAVSNLDWWWLLLTCRTCQWLRRAMAQWRKFTPAM